MQDDRYSHIEKDQLKKIDEECRAKLSWLNDMISKQNEQPKHVAPVVTTETIEKEKNVLYYFVTPILKKPKPAPKAEAKAADAKDDTPAAATADAKADPATPAQQMDVD